MIPVIFINLIIIPPRNAKIKFDAGPAKATFIMSTRGFEKLTGFIGTGLAHPNPTNNIIKDPIGSKCARGLRVKRPFLAAVWSPNRYAMYP